MHASLKEQSHKLINDCDNETLLEQAKNILQTKLEKDWWDELTEDDETNPFVSGPQYEQVDFITQAQLMQQFNANLIRLATPNRDKD